VARARFSEDLVVAPASHGVSKCLTRGHAAPDRRPRPGLDPGHDVHPTAGPCRAGRTDGPRPSSAAVLLMATAWYRAAIRRA